MILILTAPSDEHADHVEPKLRERGAEVIRWNPAQFPSEAALSLGYSPEGKLRPTLRTGDQLIELDRLKSIWYRRPEFPAPPKEAANTECRKFIAEECSNYAMDVWSCLDCLWFPARPSVIYHAQQKAFQMKVAGEMGFELPPTLISNDPDEFLDFYNQHNGNIISKLLGIAFTKHIGAKFNRYTEIVSKRNVGYAESVRYCPSIFQAYVPKRVELRITVIGEQVFAAEIHSQESHHTRYDWRRYDLYQTPHLPHDLPAELSQLCLELTRKLGLCYGAIDMVLTPDGRYVFIEINPNGQYLWIELLTELPITAALCDLLITGNKGSNKKPSSKPLTTEKAL